MFKKASSPEKASFTLVQAIGLLVITALITAGGWFLAGKQFFWTGMDSKRVESQLKYYKAEVDAQPNKAELRINLGYTYYLMHDNKAALKEFNQALALKKDFYDAYYNIGLVYVDENRLDDALEMFDKCVKLAPRDYKAFMQKGIAYREQKMYVEASDALNKANKLMPGNADIIYQIGMVAEAQGKFEAAADIYKDALSFDPLFKKAAEGLERVAKK
ncbi:MAG TPA: tetratricopeptide repeat protein [Bacillota bacterium]|nr:tetratricopeptide repeat protein [Bacillota bacterium]